jgi:hypothetical protein
MDLIIDPDLKYCPRCHGEYRAEITTCADCNLELLTGTQMLEMEEQRKKKRAARSMELHPDDEMVNVRKGPVIQMKELQILLEREGIPSLTIKDEGNCGRGCCGTDLILRVRMSDIHDVFAVLEEEHVRSTGLEDHDTSNVDAVFDTAAGQATCPACGCTFSTTQPTCPDCGLCFA